MRATDLNKGDVFLVLNDNIPDLQAGDLIRYELTLADDVSLLFVYAPRPEEEGKIFVNPEHSKREVHVDVWELNNLLRLPMRQKTREQVREDFQRLAMIMTKENNESVNEDSTTDNYFLIRKNHPYELSGLDEFLISLWYANDLTVKEFQEWAISEDAVIFANDFIETGNIKPAYLPSGLDSLENVRKLLNF